MEKFCTWFSLVVVFAGVAVLALTIFMEPSALFFTLFKQDLQILSIGFLVVGAWLILLANLLRQDRHHEELKEKIDKNLG